MRMTIFPHRGAGPIALGIERGEVRRVLGAPYSTFMKSPSSDALTDAFRSEGIYVYYDKSDRCKAIEVASPSNVVLNDQDLIGERFFEIRLWLGSQGYDVVDNDSGAICRDVGVSLYAPDRREGETSLVEAVLVFREGYF
jgi:hypothetical protein